MKDRKFFTRKTLFAAGLVLGLGTTVLAANDTINIGDGFAFLKRVGSTPEVNLGIGTDDPQAKVEVVGNVIGDDPTENTHLTTKQYVDTRVSASTPSTGGSCYYTDSVLCDSGYHLANGIGLEALNICCPDAENNTGYNDDGILTNGYFVLTGATWDGNLGGLAGANEKCLAELTDHPWKGKTNAPALTSDSVKAFLCSSTECQNLLPYTEYKFAVARNPWLGGARFMTDVNGVGPDNLDNWNDTSHFGTVDVNYWTNRARGTQTYWYNSPEGAAYSCVDWTNANAGGSGLYGINRVLGSASNRWSRGTSSCSSAFPLLCFVNPTP